MRDRLIFTGQFIFTLLVAGFLVVPATAFGTTQCTWTTS